MSSEIAVIGAGYVGLVSGVCFATFGIKVHFVERQNEKLARLKNHEIPFFEHGLAELMGQSAQKKLLGFHGSIAELFNHSSPSAVFICVGTPSMPDGSCDLRYVEAAFDEIVAHAKKDCIIVLKSTVPVGTARKLRERLAKAKSGVRLDVVNNPEFLREGTAVQDFLRPERVVIGGENAESIEALRSLYEPLLRNGHPCLTMGHESAEIAKLAANLMLASRVSVINQVSRLAAAAGGDIKEVEKVLRTDSRIGSKYLYAGLGYGGSCFPKDVKSFIHICRQYGIESLVAEATDRLNESQKEFFIPSISKNVPKGSPIAILGVAFKPETDDIRESPALTLCESLAARGYKLQVYDPEALANFQSWLQPKPWKANVQITKSLADALQGARAMILVTEWKEFQNLDLGGLKDLFTGKQVYDGKNVFNPAKIRAQGFEYLGVGRS